MSCEAGTGSETFVTDFSGIIQIDVGFELRTQSNRVFVSAANPSVSSINIYEDKIDIKSEYQIFFDEFNRFMEDYTTTFNEVLFENGQLMPIPSYSRMNFVYLDGAVIGEVDFDLIN